MRKHTRKENIFMLLVCVFCTSSALLTWLIVPMNSARSPLDANLLGMEAVGLCAALFCVQMFIFSCTPWGKP
jgi:hypothetical protein